ncbi:MAG: ATP-dependent RNA helicase HrpA, partial [Gammaproteobacteria bacterium]
MDNRPAITFPEELPVCERREEIADAIHGHQVLIVCGETGSGKTTQIPKICLQQGRGIDGFIGHTQPRRIAARTISKRIADELNSPLGHFVGYKIRHTDKTACDTYIKVMTDGILLAELQSDRMLHAYDTLIVDEAHERSLNIDFILGYLKRILPGRSDLKVIITSATIDVNRFSAHFDNTPIIEVSGRSYPVEVRYRPVNDDSEDEVSGRDAALLEAINELSHENRGDILIFLEGEGEIHETEKFLRKQQFPDTDVLPLYARLGAASQNRIFLHHKHRHIVLATNVAETSLTIPGIHSVIDTGVARISRYSHRSKVQRLPIEKISQASAEQRKGRCGRTGPGVCIRLYEESDYELRTRFTDAEILRTNLASVILQMKAMKLGDIQDFPFIDPPDQRYINDGVRLLRELGALNPGNNLTPVGRQLSRLPLDPRLGRILLAANDWHCLTETLIIVSALSIQDPRERPLDAREKADTAHAQFDSEHSDFLWFLNFWLFYRKQAHRLSQNRLRKLCRQHYISYIRVREWCDIHNQLADLCKDMGLKTNSETAAYSNIHCAILPGMLSHIAQKTESNEYTGARNIKLYVFPGSSQFQKKPKWIVAAELVETSRLYARTVARIDPKWLLKTAGHLLKRHYYEPFWDQSSQRVNAYERITLYGLTIIDRREVNYGTIDPVESRGIFIRHALVNGEYISRARFFLHNREVIEQLKRLERKSRRMDILDEEAIYRFYDTCIPAHIHDGPGLEKWYKRAEQEEPELLFLEQGEIMLHTAESITDINYPDRHRIGRACLPLNYEFKPGNENDGVTLQIPLQMLNQINAKNCEYLVPGLLEEKIQYLIKSLPKHLRKNFVPLPETARQCALEIIPGENSLVDNVSEYLSRTRGIDISSDDWRLDDMPHHLLMNFCIVDEAGSVLAEGHDLEEIRLQFGELAETHFTKIQPGVQNRNDIRRWDFGDLPDTVNISAEGVAINGYPALVDERESVALRLFDTADKAQRSMKAGLRRLFMLELSKELKYLRKSLPDINQLCMHYTSIGPCDELIDDLLQAITNQVFIEDKPIIRTEGEFIKRKQEGSLEL